MLDLTCRSYQKELLDEDNIPFGDLERNLLELDFINTWLGGHAVTVLGLAKFMKDPLRTYTILDIGSGGGDTLRFVATWAERKKLNTRLIGLDYKQEAVDFAAQKSKKFPNISFILSDYKDLPRLEVKPDIIISSLFCHHLKDEQLVGYLRLISDNAKVGFVINDLHRHFLAYYSIKWLTALFSKSYLVKNDAPLSVWRGFSRKEWEDYFAKAGLPTPNLQWKWAFRWLITSLP